MAKLKKMFGISQEYYSYGIRTSHVLIVIISNKFRVQWIKCCHGAKTLGKVRSYFHLFPKLVQVKETSDFTLMYSFMYGKVCPNST